MTPMSASEASSGSRPDVSVVVVAWPDAEGLAECLSALEPQLGTRTEVIVVLGGDPPADAVSRFSSVRWLRGVEGLIPVLWAAGMRAARGGVVAITTSHFLPAADWVASMRAAHSRLPSPAIGGVIEPPRGGTSVDWATYFLRYSTYLSYDREIDLPDVAGDNASYKAAALAAHPEWLGAGFWEQEVHRGLLASGQRVTFAPSVRVRQARSFGFRWFLAQRFAHGRQFGSDRFAGRSVLHRLAAVAASPLIPFILLGKVTARVVRSGRDFPRFLLALPALMCFVAAWSLGEVSGYLFPRRTRHSGSGVEATGPATGSPAAVGGVSR